MEIQSGNYAIQDPQIGLPSGQTLTTNSASNQAVDTAAVWGTPMDWLALGAIILGLLILALWIKRRR